MSFTSFGKYAFIFWLLLTLKAFGLQATPLQNPVVEKKEPVELALYYDSIAQLYSTTDLDSGLHYSLLALDAANASDDQNSIAQAYHTLGNANFRLGKYEEAIKNYAQALDIRRSTNNTESEISLLHNTALAYYRQQNFSEAINIYKQTIDISIKSGNLNREAITYVLLANTYFQTKNRILALEYAVKATAILINSDNVRQLARSYKLIAIIHQDIANYDLALEYFSKARDLYQELNDTLGYAGATNNIGVVLDEQGHLNEALEHYLEYLEYSLAHNDTYAQMIAYNNIGLLYFQTNRFHESLNAFQKSLSLSSADRDSSNMMNTYNNVAQVFLQMGEFDKSEQNVNAALKVMPTNKDFSMYAESNEILSKVYAGKGNFKKAYHYQSIHMDLKDSLYSHTVNAKLAEIQVSYETEQKEQQIELLKRSEEIKNLKIQKQRNTSLIWAVIAFLFIIITIYIYNILQQKTKLFALVADKNEELTQTNKKLIRSEEHLKELNATKDRLFTIIAHDLLNPMNALLGFSKLILDNYKEYDDEKKLDLIHIIYNNSQNLSMLMENTLQWARTQTEAIVYSPELFPINLIVNQEIEYHAGLISKKQLKIVNRIGDEVTAYADFNLTSIVIRNLLNNAIKFSNLLDRIIISSTLDKDMVEIKITDYGIGMSKNQVNQLFKIEKSHSSLGTSGERGTGLGLIICKDFIEKNGGEIFVSSQEGLGSTFSFTLPIAKDSGKLKEELLYSL